MLHHQRTRRRLEQNRRKALREALQEEFNSNQVDLYALQLHELVGIWVNTKKRSDLSEQEIEEQFQEVAGYSLELIRDYGANVSAGTVLGKLAADMGRTGHIFQTYRVVQKSGTKFVIFRGKPGLRRHLTAPRYKLKNPKVVSMGVGKAALGTMARGSILFTIIASPLTRGLEWLFTDKQMALESVLAGVSTDIMKAVVATGAGYFAGLLVAVSSGSMMVAVAPLTVSIAAAIFVGYGLNQLDKQFGITEQLSDALAEHKLQWEQSIRKVSRDSSYYFSTVPGQLEFMQRFLRR